MFSGKDMMERKQVEPWLIWGAAALFAFFALFLQASVSVMIDPLKSTFHISNLGIGFLASSFFYTYAVMQIPIGVLIDKFGVRRVLAVSVVGTFYSCVLFAYSDTFAGTVVCRIAMGLFAASAFPCAFCLAAVWFPKSFFPTVAGFTEMLGMLGGAFAADLLSESVLNYGWRSTMLLCGCFAATLGFLVIYTVKDRKISGMITNEHSSSNDDDSDDEEEINETKTVKQKLGYVFKNKQIWFLSLYGGMLFIPVSTFAALWGIPFIISKYNVGLRFAANCMVIVFAGAAIGNPVVAWLSDKFNRKREFMFAGSVTCLVTSIFILYFDLNHIVLFLLLFVFGIGSTAYIIPYSIVKGMVSDSVRGTAMSFTNAICGCVGTLLLQPVVGWLVHRFQDLDAAGYLTALPVNNPYSLALTVVPVFLAISFLFLFGIKFPKRTHKPLLQDIPDAIEERANKETSSEIESEGKNKDLLS